MNEHSVIAILTLFIFMFVATRVFMKLFGFSSKKMTKPTSSHSALRSNIPKTYSLFLTLFLVSICLCMFTTGSHALRLEDLLKVKPSGVDSNQILDDANCTIASIENSNSNTIYPILQELVVSITI